MTFEWSVFLFGLLIFFLGSVGILLGYAGAAAEEAERERGAMARLTLRICRFLGFTEARGEQKGHEEEDAEGRRSRSGGSMA
jgi:hypothetical protein